MQFVNFRIADIIAYHFALIDVDCRQELRMNLIRQETAYVESIGKAVRTKLPAVTLTLGNGDEQVGGVDGLIVFYFQGHIKVALFEAKWPRFGNNNYSWDYIQGNDNSHFSDQLQRQQLWKNDFAVFELFMNEEVSGYKSPPLDFFGSSCVWHRNAHKFMTDQNLLQTKWTTNKLYELLDQSGHNFYTIIYDILSCSAGRKFPIKDAQTSVTIRSTVDETKSIEDIPIPKEIGGDYEREIKEFLLKNELNQYTFIDIGNHKELLGGKE